MKKLFLFSCFSLSISLLGIFYNQETKITAEILEPNIPPMYIKSNVVSLQLYQLIERYSVEYKIPRYIAYNIAFMETRYMGPFHRSYDNDVTSPVGASGPMQIMPATARFVNKKNCTSKELRTNLDLNVKTSMHLLSILYRQSHNWAVVCGQYNTGKPIINSYAVYCSTNKDYRRRWIYP